MFSQAVSFNVFTGGDVFAGGVSPWRVCLGAVCFVDVWPRERAQRPPDCVGRRAELE